MNRKFPEIRTRRLHLREIMDADLLNIYRGLSDPRVNRYYGVSFNSPEAIREQMIWYRDILRDQTGIWWAISSPDTGEFYGAAGLNDIRMEHLKGETGFWLLPEYRGHGYISEALQAILHYGFNTLKLHRIEAFVESENMHPDKVLRNLGFEKEGTLKECEIKNNRLISLDIYARLAENNKNGDSR